MYETDEEVAALQALLDRSHAGSTDHLKAIIHDDRMLRATDLVSLLTGMKVLSLATVTAAGEPRISAVDGHFLHGTCHSARAVRRPRRATWPRGLRPAWRTSTARRWRCSATATHCR